MDVLKILIACYAVLLVISSIVSFQLWLFYRTKPFFLLMLVWPATFINFVLQGVFVESFTGSVLSFSTYFVTAICLTKLLCIISEIQFNWRPYAIFFGLAGVISACIYIISDSFFWVSLPIAIAIAAPQILVPLRKLSRHRTSGPELTNTFAVTLLVNGIHFLDFPYLRPLPEAAVYGFGIVMIITILFSLLLPVIISKHNTNLLNDQLQKEINQTRQLAKAKSDFLANMSHEIRTPINGIRGINDLLLTSNLDPEQRQYCEITRQSVDRLTNIISDILSLSQLESGKVNIHREAVSPNSIQKEILDHYSVRSDVGALDLSCDISLWPHSDIIIDRGKVMQVLFNLANNAIKYTTGDKVSIRFELQSPKGPEDRPWLILKVFDNGEGIAEDAQKVIFSAFEQLSTGKGGAGLGLSIVSRLVEVLEGSISLKSNSQYGTEFICHFPTQYAQPVDLGCGRTSKPIPADLVCAKPLRGRPTKVLAVEDDPTSQMILAAVFEKEGIMGTVVGSAEIAIHELEKNNFDMVITDVNLPGMTGLELVKTIRAKDSNIPVIIQSAFSFDDDTIEAKNRGATAYLRKPLTYHDIVSVCECYGGHTRSSSRGAA